MSTNDSDAEVEPRGWAGVEDEVRKIVELLRPDAI